MIYKHKTTGTQAKLNSSDGKYYIHNCSIGIPKQFIEDSDDWVKQTNYEILSFISKNGLLWEKTREDLFGNNFTYISENTCLKFHKINSVKRISDGEIFTLSGKVKINSSIYTGNISSLVRSMDSIYTTFKIDDTKEGCAYLEDIVKVKQPIIVTQDGVELFKGDSYYTVFTMNDSRYDTWTTQDKPFIIDCSASKYIHKDVKYFAKKENVEKFIKENKPQYSLNDIKETVKKLGCLGTTLIEYLESNDG